MDNFRLANVVVVVLKMIEVDDPYILKFVRRTLKRISLQNQLSKLIQCFRLR